MRRGPRALVAFLATALLLLASVSLAAAQSNTTTVVKPNDVTLDGPWYPISGGSGAYEFMYGPATPPLGIGSVELTTTTSTDRIFLYTHAFDGESLSDITDISYETYRSSFATNSSNTPFIVLDVIDATGTEAATFFWDPGTAYGAAALKADTWQTWDAMAASNTAAWWSPSDIGSYVATTKVSWSTLLTDIPGGDVNDAIGFAAGSIYGSPAWDGAFTGNVDAFKVTDSGDTTTYDFEPFINPPTSYAQCYFGGWQNFDNPFFSSQAQCTSYVAAQQLQNYYCSRFSFLPICQDAVTRTGS